MAALPAELRSRSSRLVQRFHLDAGAWFRASEPVPHLATVAEAVWGSRRLEIAYRRDANTATRTLEPLGIVLKAGTWYLVAGSDGEPRTYRVSRIAEARALDESFDRPPDFDLAAWWAESSAAYERDAPKVDIVVRVPADQSWRLADAVGERPFREARRVRAPESEGRETFRVTVAWPEELTGRFVAAAPEVELLEPARLRDEILAAARTAIEAYSRP